MQETEQKTNAFLDSVFIMSHSYSTVSSYRLAIENKNNTGLRDFLQQRYNINELEFVEQTKQKKFDVYAVLRDYVIFLDKNSYKPKTITSRLAAIKGYLRFLGLKIYTEDCKHIIRVPKNIQEQPEVALTKEIILRLLRNAPPRLQTVILVLSSSGIRIGELVQLKLSDIDFTTTPTTIRLRAQITKTRHARETFITAEATNSLKDYLSRLLKWDEKKDNSCFNDVLIFGRDLSSKRKKKENPKQPAHLVAEGGLMRQLKYYLEKIPDLNKTNANGIRVIHYHALRKFFRTTVGNASGRDFAEALIGHQFYMSTYYQLNDEKKREMYLEVEPYLTISDFKAVENKIQSISLEQEKLKTIIEELKANLIVNHVPVPQELMRF